MNTSAINSVNQNKPDRSLLQSLLPAVKPREDFNQIMMSTQVRADDSRSAAAKSDRADSSDRRDRAFDGSAARETRRQERGSQAESVEKNVQAKARGDNPERRQQTDRDRPVEPDAEGGGVEAVSKDEPLAEDVDARPVEESADSPAVAEDGNATEGEVELLVNLDEGGESVDDKLAAAVDEEISSALLPDSEQPPQGEGVVSFEAEESSGEGDSLLGVGIDAVGEKPGVDSDADLQGLMREGRADSLSAMDTAKVAVKEASVKPSASRENPLQQVIEVEKLLSDKSLLGTSVSDNKSPMALSMKLDGIADSAELPGLRLGNALGMSVFKAEFAQQAVLQDVKLTETASLKVGGATALSSALEVRPTSPLLSQSQAVTAKDLTQPLTTQASLGQPAWGKAVGERVLMMAAKNLSSAEIQLDPPELGQLQVRVVVQHDQASVTFVSPQQSVRDALDESSQRLRDMFEGEGIDLVNVDVSDQAGSDLGNDEQSAAEGGALAEGELDSEQGAVSELSLGLVDHYV